jgi:hypothetical protein
LGDFDPLQSESVDDFLKPSVDSRSLSEDELVSENPKRLFSAAVVEVKPFGLDPSTVASFLNLDNGAVRLDLFAVDIPVYLNTWSNTNGMINKRGGN